jgi:hypothetical protein
METNGKELGEDNKPLAKARLKKLSPGIYSSEVFSVQLERLVPFGVVGMVVLSLKMT